MNIQIRKMQTQYMKKDYKTYGLNCKKLICFYIFMWRKNLFPPQELYFLKKTSHEKNNYAFQYSYLLFF